MIHVYFSLRKGKYFQYKLKFLEYLIEKNFLIELENVYFRSLTLAEHLNIPTSSWYDIVNGLATSGLIIVKKRQSYLGLVWTPLE